MALCHLLFTTTGPIECKKSKGAGIFLLVALQLVCGVKGLKKAHNTIGYMLFSQTKQSLQEYKAYGDAKEERIDNLKNLVHLSIDEKKGGLFVLVIGESETRDHMQVYGYPRPTTPWMNLMARRDGTVLFFNAYSNHTHTVPTLTYALTEKNQYSTIKFKNAYSIIETARAAGYETYWLSNQVKYGIYDTPIAEIASTANHEIWINGNSGNSNKTSYLDEELVKRLQEIPFSTGGNKFIVIHLMGSHVDYQERYPKAKEKFSVKDKKQRRVNSYDNSVVYTDYVLKQIYNVVRYQPSFKGMIYLSDHGEDMKASHEVTKFTWTMAHIPFFIHLSSSYCKANPEIYNTLLAHKKFGWTTICFMMFCYLLWEFKMSPIETRHWT